MAARQKPQPPRTLQFPSRVTVPAGFAVQADAPRPTQAGAKIELIAAIEPQRMADLILGQGTR
jgi:hypothetical protein